MNVMLSGAVAGVAQLGIVYRIMGIAGWFRDYCVNSRSPSGFAK